MKVDIHKLIQESVESVQEQDIHIHVGGESTPSSSTSSAPSQSSSQGGQNTNSNSQQISQQGSGDQTGNKPAQLLKKQLQGDQQQQGAGQPVSQQSSQGPTMQPTSVHPIQHQNNVHHVGQMMQKHRTATADGQQQKSGPVKITKPRFNEATKREMKEIYVRNHIRRIGRRPTSQDVDRKFNDI